MELNSVYPGDEKNMAYWCKKLHASEVEIRQAILYTGSLNPEKLKIYLRKDSLIHHPIEGFRKAFRSTINYIF